MMKNLLLAFVIFAASFLTAKGETNSTKTLRKLFHAAVLDDQLIPEFTSYVAGIDHPSPLELAYQAAGEALKAQEEWNPVEKLLYLKRFQKKMRKAISQGTDEIEIRFLRFGIEYHIPSILGFSSNLREDKTMIIDSVAQIDRFEIDQYFTAYILTLLSDSGLCTNREIELVKSKIQP